MARNGDFPKYLDIRQQQQAGKEMYEARENTAIKGMPWKGENQKI
jgi:hypothetical protein